jgi:ADP-heptose:LPS heptosyltransferase
MKIETDLREPLKKDNVKHIGIYCCGLFGDVLIRTPFIEKVAELFPQAQITAIVDPNREPLLANHPAVQTILVFDRRKTSRWKYFKNFFSFIKTLQQQKFDLYFDLYTGGSSALIAKLSGAKYRFGFFFNKKMKACFTHAYQKSMFSGHWGQELGYLLSEFKVKPSDLRAGTTFNITPAAQAAAQEIMTKRAKPWVLINLGAGCEKKIWPIERQVEIAQWLAETYDFHIGIFQNPGQEYLTTEFAGEALTKNFKQYQILPTLPIDVAAAVIQAARFVITGDTGIMHLAFGVKTPTIILFTYTRPEIVMPSDCIAKACFIPHPTEQDALGRPVGERNLSVDIVKQNIEELLNTL